MIDAFLMRIGAAVAARITCGGDQYSNQDGQSSERNQLARWDTSGLLGQEVSATCD
ncbi:hypothetical protein [Rhodopirellula sp. SWK7]|uniref:hypothetical protein n=1 Tax=Rhodopirellula sp. SWK7 TaxID=595460 RepID=UPI0002BE27BF|nr:hypothetical protein [Rhodopirellula sp. SWK7]EMI43083.1 hypothetical protein RRSWK_04384 [Rhodopirellula sp. SWK7]